jgi:hypothetical protein
MKSPLASTLPDHITRHVRRSTMNEIRELEDRMDRKVRGEGKQ